MNREISSNINAYGGMQRAIKQDNVAFHSNNGVPVDDTNTKKMDESFAYLDSVGRSQVNMEKPSKTTLDAVSKYMDDPLYVEQQIAFCDDLVNKGYSLEEADRITQEVFSNLSNKNTYQK